MRSFSTLSIAVLVAALLSACGEDSGSLMLDAATGVDAGTLDASAIDAAHADTGVSEDAARGDAAPDAVVDGAIDGDDASTEADADVLDAEADAAEPDAAVTSMDAALVESDAHVDADTTSIDAAVFVDAALDASADADAWVYVTDSSEPDASTYVPPVCEDEGYCDDTCLSPRTRVVSVPQGSEGQGWFGIDADGDGNDDLVSVLQAGSGLLIYRGDGRGVFSSAVSLATGRNHGDLAFGDFDGDGRSDMLLSQPDSSQLQLVRRTASSWTVDAPFSQGSTPRHLDPIDYDHDGKLDALIYLAGSGCLVVRRGNGDGTFAPAGGCVLTVAVPYNVYTVTTLDWDGDGFEDIAHAVGSSITIYRTTGSGIESLTTIHASGVVGALKRVRLGGAAADDLAAMRVAGTATAPGPIDIYRNDGFFRCAGAFGTSFRPSPATGMQGASTFVADFDGDGIPDPMWREPGPGPLKVLLSNEPDFGPFATQFLSLNGASSGVELPPNASFGDVGTAFTIEAWVRPTTTEVTDQATIFSRRAHFRDYHLLWSRGGDGRFRFDVYDDGDVLAAAIAPEASAVDRWHHVAGVVDGRDVRLYIDGVRVASVTAANAITWKQVEPRATLHSEYGVFIGYSRSPGDSGAPAATRFRGSLDDVRVSDVARYSGASFSHLTATTSDTATVGLWSFEETSGTTALDTGRSASLHGTFMGGAARARE